MVPFPRQSAVFKVDSQGPRHRWWCCHDETKLETPSIVTAQHATHARRNLAGSMAVQTLPDLVDIATKKQPVKYVYFFGAGKAEGSGKMKDEFAGKGAGLTDMTNAGLPVPPGFTIQTEALPRIHAPG